MRIKWRIIKFYFSWVLRLWQLVTVTNHLQCTNSPESGSLSQALDRPVNLRNNNCNYNNNNNVQSSIFYSSTSSSNINRSRWNNDYCNNKNSSKWLSRRTPPRRIKSIAVFITSIIFWTILLHRQMYRCRYAICYKSAWNIVNLIKISQLPRFALKIREICENNRCECMIFFFVQRSSVPDSQISPGYGGSVQMASTHRLAHSYSHPSTMPQQ